MAVPWSTSCRSTKPLQHLIVDLSGKRPRSSGGAEALMMMVDDCSRFSWSYFVKKKSDVPAVFASFLTDIRAQGTPSPGLRSDNGTDLTNQEFVALLDHHSIRREYTPVDSPKHDNVAERCIAMTLELAMPCCLEVPRLFGGGPLPPTEPLCGEVRIYACVALNMTERVGGRQEQLSPCQKVHGNASFPRLLSFFEARVPPR